MSWEGGTANRTSGLVTALINLPPGHKSPVLHSVFHTATFTRVLGGRFLSESQSHQHKHRTQLYVRVCIYIYIYLSI